MNNNPICDLKIATVNTRSVRNKPLEIYDLILDKNLDILIITESWIFDNSVDIDILNTLTPDGYVYFSAPRHGRRGGGILIVYKEPVQLCFKVLETFEFAEMVELEITSKFFRKFKLLAVYRPPNQNAVAFIDFLNDYLGEFYLQKDDYLMIIGDLNIKFDDKNDRLTCRLENVLHEKHFVQLVDFHTRFSTNIKHILDLVIVNDEDIVREVYPLAHVSSDHVTVVCALNIPTVEDTCSPVSRVIKDWKNANENCLLMNVSQSFQNYDFFDCYEVDKLTELYLHNIETAVDEHIPLKFVYSKPKALPFFDHDLRLAKRQRRQLERKFKKTKTNLDWKNYKKCCADYSKLIHQKKCKYYKEKLRQADSKTFLKINQNLMSKDKKQSFPTKVENLKMLPGIFNKFFLEKVIKLRETIPLIPPPIYVKAPNLNSDNALEHFNIVTVDETEKAIKSISSKQCSLDPIPTWFIKKHLSFFAPYVTHLVNVSFCCQTFPNILKNAIVFPMLKDSKKDLNDLKNFRPVSNIHFLSKVMERIVDNCISAYLENNGLDEIFQSGFKKGHGVETALLKILNDIYINRDKKQYSILCLIDLSAAFDTIDHNILCDILINRFNITNSALNWLVSFLQNRKQKVLIEKNESAFEPLSYGIPQGSILGPKIFSMYISPIYEIFKNNNVKFHGYADDTQFYIEVSKQNLDDAKTVVINILDEIKYWLSSHKLKMNSDKT